MSIHADVITALAGVAGGRVAPEAIEQDTPRPFVIVVRKDRDPLNTFLGATGDVNSEIILECYADHKLDALALADQVRAAIVAARAISLGGTGVLPVQYEIAVSTEDYTPETMEYMEPVGYGFWHS